MELKSSREPQDELNGAFRPFYQISDQCSFDKAWLCVLFKSVHVLTTKKRKENISTIWAFDFVKPQSYSGE